jgi:hypothetical protein
MDKGLSATALTLLQEFVVIFLLLHDWVPLGRFNNLAAIRTEDSLLRRVVVTLLSALPPIVGLVWSTYFGQVHPGWLWWYLLITYGGFWQDCYGLGGYPICWCPIRHGRRATR